MAPPALPDRTFEAIVFDWDGTAVPDRSADAAAVRQRVVALADAGVQVVVVSGTHVGNIDGQLGARPTAAGRLHLCLNRGSEVFEVGADGPRLVWHRQAAPWEEAALDEAAARAVARLAGHGIAAEVVSQRLNRRKIDIIPEPAWRDPPKARIAELLEAVTARLVDHGIEDGLAGAVAIGTKAAVDVGLADPRVTSDAKHVEIGLTDKSDSMRWVLQHLAEDGIGPGLVLIGGDEFGDLGNVIGSDALMLVPEVARATVVSVGVEPQGVPEGVLHLGGGPERFLALLDDQLERRRQKRVPAIDHDPAWVVELVDDPIRRRTNESVATVSNGWIGIRGAREEDGPGTEPQVLVAGVYTSQAVPRLLSGPVWPALVVRGGESPDRWALDLRTGVLGRDRDGGGKHLRTVRFASLADPTAMAARAEGPVSRMAAGDGIIEPDVTTVFRHERDADGEVGVTRSATGGGIVVATTTSETRAGGYRCVERLATWLGDDHAEPSADDARQRVRDLRAIGFDRLLADHRRAWAARWRDAEVVIDSDPACELGVRFALFHLLAAVADRGEAAVGARGLTGGAYSGHVFWDADVFVLPVLAAVHPPSARAMLEYRIRRLPAARRAAASAGRAGARFPWESAAAGVDVTPSFARDRNGTIVPIRTGLLEDHINADVAWAACEYAAWTGDEAFLHGEGRDLVLDTARWWASRVRIDRHGEGHLYGVIGPDEYHEPVDDNAFTNVMVRWHLRRAAALAESAGGATPDEVAAWRRIAGALVDGYRAETGLYEQFAGYFQLDPLLIADYAHPPVAADVLLGSDTVHRSQLIKQADVVMLHHLVPDEVAPGSLRPNVEYYGPRTAHGSSLSPPIQAAALARAGRPDDALELFRVACRLDLDDLTTTTAGGLHLATMGGVWQALTTGFCGIRPLADGLAVDPALPSSWRAVEVSFRYHGQRIRLRVAGDDVVVTSERDVRLLIGPGRAPVTTSAGSTTIPLPRSSS